MFTGLCLISARSTAAYRFNDDAALGQSSKPVTKTEYRVLLKSCGGTREDREAFISKALREGTLKEERRGKVHYLGTPEAFRLFPLSP